MIEMSSAVKKILLIVAFLGLSYEAHCYDLGVQYLYQYHTQVSTGKDCPKDEESQVKNNAGFEIKSAIFITCIWENEQNKEEKLIKIEFTKPSLTVPKKSSYQAHNSKLESLPQSPLFVKFLNGELKTVFGDAAEDSSLKNLKKGIASLLQVSSSSVMTDVSGDCVIKVETEGRFIKKKKENCFHPATNKFRYGSSDIRSSKITSVSETKVELVAQKSNLVLSAEGIDYFALHSNMWKRPEVCVYSKTSLSLENESSGASTVKAKSLSEAIETSVRLSDGRFKQESVVADIVPKKCGNNCKDIPKVVRGYKENLSTKNLAKLKSASSFLKLLEIFQLASKEDILSTFKNEKFKSVHPQLIDVLAYAQSKSSLEAAVETMDIFSKNSDLIERLLLGLCTSSHPDAELLERMLAMLKKGQENKKIHATLVTALGALVKSYTRRHEELSTDEVVGNIEKFFIQELKSCTKRRDFPECEMVYLRGLRNAALPSSLNVLLEYASGGDKPALEALLALKNIDQHFDTEAVKVFEEVFHQIKKKHVSSSRAVAAELLLTSNPSVEVMKRIFDELRKPRNLEFATFVSSKIHKIIDSDEKLRSKVQAVLASEGVKYNSFFLKGSSVSYTKPLIGATSVNATYGIEMEMMPGGNLKRSSFDVNIFTHDSNLHVLSVGMYSEGLASLGGTGKSSEEEEEPTAGMELTVLGVALRPYVFFQGTSNLFSLVWSGAGSEPTPALQGNMLLIDDSATLILHNGLAVDLKLKGVLSADLSASIEISMWYKTSHSVVNNAVAILVKGSAHVETSFVTVLGEFSFMGESAIGFITDSDFSDAPFKMCLQMTQPEFLFRNNFLTTEQIPGTKYSLKANKKRKLLVPAVSFYLHQDNNKQCASLLGES